MRHVGFRGAPTGGRRLGFGAGGPCRITRCVDRGVISMSAATSAGPAYQTVNPANGEVVETFATATDAEVESALAGAHAAYVEWRQVPIDERAAIVRRIGELFVERRGDLSVIATREMGKPLPEARGEAKFCGEIFDY